MTDATWQILIGGIVTVLITGMQLVIKRRIDQVAETSEKIHLLTNSGLGLQLRVNAVMARRLAFITGEEVDKKNADIAEADLKEHDLRQSRLDQKYDKDIP